MLHSGQFLTKKNTGNSITSPSIFCAVSTTSIQLFLHSRLVDYKEPQCEFILYYVSTCYPINCIQILQDSKKTAPPVAYKLH